MERKITKLLLNKFNNKIGVAIDLGCGDGFDTIFLLNNNWTVIAIDLFTESIYKNTKNLNGSVKNKLIIKRQELENLDIPKVDLILANYSIPYCNREKIENLFKKIKSSLNIGGKFAGILYGENDYRNDKDFIYCMSKEEILNIFKGKFEIEYFSEKEEFINVGKEIEKEHIYEIIVKRIGE